MKTSKAYDLPLRIFHWAFALLFVFSFSVGKFVDDDSWLYAYHMLSGMTMVFMVLLRIGWGFWGSWTSRFSSFQLAPKKLIEYFTSMFSSKTTRHLGHNPASSWAALVMFGLTLLIGTTGGLMIFGFDKHFFKEVHEILAMGFAILVVGHIAGVLFHQMKHKDGMMFSMATGNKAGVSGEDEISSDHKGVAVVFVAAVLVFGSYLLTNFDST